MKKDPKKKFQITHMVKKGNVYQTIVNCTHVCSCSASIFLVCCLILSSRCPSWSFFCCRIRAGLEYLQIIVKCNRKAKTPRPHSNMQTILRVCTKHHTAVGKTYLLNLKRFTPESFSTCNFLLQLQIFFNCLGINFTL